MKADVQLIDLARFRAQYVIVETHRHTCETCGFPIYFDKLETGEMIPQPHWYCSDPTISVVTHNPRRLGVITGIEP